MIVLPPDVREFPNPSRADVHGLLAMGGDLSVERLVLAYRSGIFPWTDEPLTWWSPDPRALFELETFTAPKRLRQKMRQAPFRITFDTAFREVIGNCARTAPGRDSTWISEAFITAYTELHRQGHAHSVEAWEGDKLAGGVYGVSIGGFFAGESMFHHATDASKIALVSLFDRLQSRGFVLFDTQVLSPLTARLGAIEVRRTDYLRRLRKAVALPDRW